MFCHNCGFTFDEGDICPICGSSDASEDITAKEASVAQTPPQPDSPPAPHPEKPAVGRRLLITVTAILCSLMLLCTGVIVWLLITLPQRMHQDAMLYYGNSYLYQTPEQYEQGNSLWNSYQLESGTLELGSSYDFGNGNSVTFRGCDIIEQSEGEDEKTHVLFQLTFVNYNSMPQQYLFNLRSYSMEEMSQSFATEPQYTVRTVSILNEEDELQNITSSEEDAVSGLTMKVDANSKCNISVEITGKKPQSSLMLNIFMHNTEDNYDLISLLQADFNE